jgi:glycosyltransferase involved in cell wall biosynthesis
MKIAYLSTFYPFRGGIAQFNASLYRAFEKDGHTVKAFTFTRQYPSFLFPGETQMVTGNDKEVQIPSERILDTLNPFSYYLTAKKIQKFFPDILLMKYWLPYMAPALGTVAKMLKKHSKVITILDNVIPHEKKFFDVPLTKYFLKQNHGFVVMSDAVKNDLLKFIPNAKYIFHPHPLYEHFGERIDAAEARKKLNIPDGKKIILFFGFIRKYKGLDILLKALAKLYSDYVLIIAGEVYGSFEEYQILIDALVLEKQVYLHTRYISNEEVPLFFSAADVCVLPYKSATQSGIISIAYHFDLPVIATNVGGLSESVLHNRTGIVVDAADAKLIAKAIENYFSHNMKPKFQSEIQSLKKQLSWNSMAKAIIDFSC